MRGRITYWNSEKFFGFVETETDSFFFHGRSWVGDADSTPPMIGDVVSFEISSSDRGSAAVRVELVGGAVTGDDLQRGAAADGEGQEARMYANVLAYAPDRGFGFAVTLNEKIVFFRISAFAEHPEAVEYGDLLEFDAVLGPKGLRAVRITRIDCELPEAAVA